MIYSVMTTSGSFIPPVVVPNDHFLNNEFFDVDGNRYSKSNAEIVRKLFEITGIRERRYITDDMTTSDMAHLAAEKALAGVDRESLDYIIVAQNFGDVRPDSRYTDMVPTIAARVKHKLRIKNPYTVAFDLPFGCPGWLQGIIMADTFIKAGQAKRILVIGAESLSRVSDPHDIDCMIFADAAGAVLVEAAHQTSGILAHMVRSDTYSDAYLLQMGRSYHPSHNGNDLFIKMNGHDIYRYAVKRVPEVVKLTLEKAGVELADVAKVLIHQANEKMDKAIVKRLFKLYGMSEVPDDIMPMIIAWSGNSSVASLPVIFDLICRGQLDGHRLHSGQTVVFASVGAGMNINAMVYQMP